MGWLICKKQFFITVCLFLSLICPIISYALTPQQVIDLKKAGVSDKTIQMMIEQEERAKDPYATVGIKEIKDKELLYQIQPLKNFKKNKKSSMLEVADGRRIASTYSKL